ncbi:MAG: IS4 family transposase [Chloroflexota bacterium]
MRLVCLLALSVRLVIEVAYGGKGTGERALLRQILGRVVRQGLLFLLDAGLYAFELVWAIADQNQEFLVKVPRTAKLKRLKTLPDGSYLAQVNGKIEDPEPPASEKGRPRWKKVSLVVRVIDYTIPGFRPVRLMTNILDLDITARELVLHYHKRWDIELTYDEIKTHQCVTLRGQSPTTFRSKRPDLVEQELYAMLIMYNLVRLLIAQAATAHGKDPRLISFSDALQHLRDATPLLTTLGTEQRTIEFEYLLAVIAAGEIDRPRRARINPRVVKVKMSKFNRKGPQDKSAYRDLATELEIMEPPSDTPAELTLKSEPPAPPKDVMALIIMATLAGGHPLFRLRHRREISFTGIAFNTGRLALVLRS